MPVAGQFTVERQGGEEIAHQAFRGRHHGVLHGLAGQNDVQESPGRQRLQFPKPAGVALQVLPPDGGLSFVKR